MLAAGVAFSSCSGTKKTATNTNIPSPPVVEEVTPPDDVEMPEAERSNDLPVYQATATRKFDLLHTSLDVSFDWKKQYLLGKARLTMKPYFYPSNLLTLEAKSFDVKRVALVEGDNLKDLTFKYSDGKQIDIVLDKVYKADQTFTVFVDYVAKPEERKTGGSAAISSDKGLYFINPLGEDPSTPQQIWTQGETESSSCWFPTFDKPNERCTQDIKITVDEKYKTLSNGVLKTSTKNTDGTRTDYWVMDKPHAPYLFMMAVGDFAVVKDKWNNIDVDYYVEPKFEKDAKAIFPHTPEMLQFFSDKLGVTYPWSKYAQIIVREYVSGAMENTTAVIFGDFLQKSSRELIDASINESIVAHEMFHHWFGDLVTCEHWTNLTLNESFANYSEYLWFEHKHGRDMADHHRQEEMQGYLGQASGGSIHPLVHFGYDDKEDMFDAHSYNKGGTILHMLRDYVGDDAFFAALKKYLTDNQYTAAEAHQLRLAFEAVTGEDLNWFFNQWYFSAGHPVLEIQHHYNAADKEVEINVVQTQEGENVPHIFRLPIAIDIYDASGKATRHNVVLNQRDQTLHLPAASEPAWVNVDANKMLLCEKQINQSDEAYAFQYLHAKNYFDRDEALTHLSNDFNSDPAKKVMTAALNDPFFDIRQRAIGMVDAKQNTTKLTDLAKNDKHSAVRAAALQALGETGDKAYIDLAKTIVKTEKAYPVISSAISLINTLAPEQALGMAKDLENDENSDIIDAVADIYGSTGDAKYMSYFESKFDKVSGYGAFSFFDKYLKLVKSAPADKQANSVTTLTNLATNMTTSPFTRYAATKTLSDFSKHLKTSGGTSPLIDSISKAIAEIKTKEVIPQLRKLYDSL